MVCSACNTYVVHVKFIFRPEVRTDIKPAVTFYKRFVQDVQCGVKTSTVRQKVPSTWKVGALVKAQWYPSGWGKPQSFGILSLTAVESLRIGDFTPAYVTTGQTLQAYVQEWVLPDGRSCTCGRWIRT